MKPKRPPKLEDVLDLADGILHEKLVNTSLFQCRHDQYKEEWNAWNYAIRGTTLQEDIVRVIVTFDESTKLLIITVINIVKRE